MEPSDYNMRRDRKKRVQSLKRAIIGLTLTLIIVPTLLCVILTFRICSLEKEIDDMLAQKTESTVGDGEGDSSTTESQLSDGNDSTEETSSLNESNSSAESESTDDEAATVEPLPDGKYVYLTFDDGPSPRTDEILEILDQYGVKATFFVNGHTGETMEARYKAIVEGGHALGIHTYTHKYESVYSGIDGFANEVQSLHDYLYEVTGVDVRLFRFPGGSSNSIVDDIQPYIQWINDNGYSYHDWNCSSGDASSKKPTAEQIIQNCMAEINAGYENLVILMHDLGTKDTTVEALPKLIEKLLENGYEIRAIDERSTPIHHREAK